MKNLKLKAARAAMGLSQQALAELGDAGAALVPVLLALIPITILVMTVSGCVTQRLAERKEKKQ